MVPPPGVATRETMKNGNIPQQAPVATVVNVTMRDELGELGKASRCLANAGIRVDGFAATTRAARFITDNPTKAVAALEAGGHTAEALPYWSLSLDDQTKQMAVIGEELAKEGVPIHDAFTAADTKGDKKLFFRCGNPGTTLKVLRRIGSVAALAAEAAF